MLGWVDSLDYVSLVSSQGPLEVEEESRGFREMWRGRGVRGRGDVSCGYRL